MISNTIVAIITTILGILLGSGIAITWAQKNGRALGRRIGSLLPGDSIEKWLSDFFEGIRLGLKDTYTIEASKVENPSPGADTTWQINFKKES